MNIHIELVKKWMADKDSVTKQELDDNAKAAYCATGVASAADAACDAASAAAYAAYNAADADDDADACANAGVATYWVKCYEELTR